MSTLKIQNIRLWVKTSDSTLARVITNIWCHMKYIEMPILPLIHKTLYWLHRFVVNTVSSIIRVIYWTPLFKSRLSSGSAKGLYLYGGLPCVLGSVDITMGRNCRLAAKTTISGRNVGAKSSQLIIGNNVGIGWRTTIAVGKKIVLGENVRIAGDSYLAGYPGHPVNALDRASGMPDTEDQVGNIILEDDVWLATGVSVMAGVTIGRGTIVGAGSVVTKNLPPGVLAGGVPAVVIKNIDRSDWHD